MSAALITKLVAAGVAADLVAEVAMALAEATAGQKALAQRREADRDRKQRERERNASRDVTGRHALSAETSDVTPASPLDKKAPPDPLKELNPPTPSDDAKASSEPPAGAAAGKRISKRRQGKRKTGSRLPDDWQPPAIADLPLEAQAVVSKWPAGAYELTAASFRNHWLAEGRAIGAKRDWLRTWCNWLFKEVAEIARKQRAGFDFAAAGYALRPGGEAGPVDAQRLRESAARYRRIGRDDEADECERRAAAAEAKLDTS